MKCPSCDGYVLTRVKPCENCAYVIMGKQTSELAVLGSIDRSLHSIRKILMAFLVLVIVGIVAGVILMLMTAK